MIVDTFRIILIHHADISFPQFILSPNIMLADLSSTVLEVMPESALNSDDEDSDLHIQKKVDGKVRSRGMLNIAHAKKSNKGVQEVLPWYLPVFPSRAMMLMDLSTLE